MFRYKWLGIICWLLVASSTLQADGLLRSTKSEYPWDFMRHRMTRVDVYLHSQFAETQVYQEFVNDWVRATDAVFAFPLPPDARANNFFYWRNDTCFKAILKVSEQAPNPGTGEGGIAALVNQYIGRNGIKIALKGIAAGAIQKTQLNYISQCDYYQGRMSYEFPLETQDFLTYPIDLLEVNFYIYSNAAVTETVLKSHAGAKILVNDANFTHVQYRKSKAYLNKDLLFEYVVPNPTLGVDFYSVANDSVAGHFVMAVKPDESTDPGTVFNKRILFLLDVSYGMYGDRFTQSIQAVQQCLDLLQPGDFFNIGTFSQYPGFWKPALAAADAANLQMAKSYLSTITLRSGSDMNRALSDGLKQFTDQALPNAILAFSSGFTVLDPREIEQKNQPQVGIFMIGTGDQVERARLEMTALLNYGFVTYLNEQENIPQRIARVFNQIHQPILNQTRFEYGLAQVSDVFPTKIPTIYRGARLFLTGRYQKGGVSAFSIAGFAKTGPQALDFHLNFAIDTQPHKFAESFWAKEKIDALEREVLVYGETSSLREELIRLSLTYNIRCKYTAYIATYDPAVTGVSDPAPEIAAVPKSYLLGNYPNPFNPSTTIRFYIAPGAEQVKIKYLRIYNLLGQLVAVIDLSEFGVGFHAIQFQAIDQQGMALPSGTYFCQLVVGDAVSHLRISLIR